MADDLDLLPLEDLADACAKAPWTQGTMVGLLREHFSGNVPEFVEAASPETVITLVRRVMALEEKIDRMRSPRYLPMRCRSCDGQILWNPVDNTLSCEGCG